MLPRIMWEIFNVKNLFYLSFQSYWIVCFFFSPVNKWESTRLITCTVYCLTQGKHCPYLGQNQLAGIKTLHGFLMQVLLHQYLWCLYLMTVEDVFPLGEFI